ncbi:hypothetical protein DY000_02050609 [Brassica cretica]|uniref:Uncharacterized protein n=1 Tax=Brassica cretica TaxID=69181 RepID=A0ABQ7EPA6_BRACR|nr:hypothetical protein DY000_02050609 [Brassica cretica]
MREAEVESAEERETTTMDETETQRDDPQALQRCKRDEIQIADTMVETEEKAFEGGYETEVNIKSGKEDKMDEDEDTLLGSTMLFGFVSGHFFSCP